MELRVVASLVDEHEIPLQTVRRAADAAKRLFETKYPFASRRIWVERRRIFASLSRTDQEEIAEITRHANGQLGWSTILQPLLRDVEFDVATFLTKRWWPLGPSEPIVLDPAICFGAPCVNGTRVRTVVVAGMVAASSVTEAAEAYDISREAVAAACRFEVELHRHASM